MMSPLRVLCVTPFGPSGKGGIDRLYLYLRDLVERYGMPDVDLRFARARGSAAGNAWMASFPLILGEFAWTLARLRPHVVHINFATGGSLPRKFAILKLARLFGAPTQWLILPAAAPAAERAAWQDMVDDYLLGRDELMRAMVLVDGDGFWTRSDAALRIAGHMGGVWSLAVALRNGAVFLDPLGFKPTTVNA